MTKVLIVEDDPMAQSLMELFVKNSGRYELAACIESAAFALSYCMQNRVDLILMDVCTALDASGLMEAAKIKARLPDIKIIIVTSQPECDFIQRARMGSVDSFWYKTPREGEMLGVMDRTMAGEHIYPDTTPEVMVGGLSSREFTARELEVLRELLTGDSNAQIAERLGISEKNVRNYVSSMMAKTGLDTRTKLAVAADRSGIVNKDF